VYTKVRRSVFASAGIGRTVPGVFYATAQGAAVSPAAAGPAKVISATGVAAKPIAALEERRFFNHRPQDSAVTSRRSLKLSSSASVAAVYLSRRSPAKADDRRAFQLNGMN
jgi:hypothetical protein